MPISEMIQFGAFIDVHALKFKLLSRASTDETGNEPGSSAGKALGSWIWWWWISQSRNHDIHKINCNERFVSILAAQCHRSGVRLPCKQERLVCVRSGNWWPNSDLSTTWVISKVAEAADHHIVVKLPPSPRAPVWSPKWTVWNQACDQPDFEEFWKQAHGLMGLSYEAIWPYEPASWIQHDMFWFHAHFWFSHWLAAAVTLEKEFQKNKNDGQHSVQWTNDIRSRNIRNFGFASQLGW